MTTAATAFHVIDPETRRPRAFRKGDDVPDHVVAVVGPHVLTDATVAVEVPVEEAPANAPVVDDDPTGDLDDLDAAAADEEGSSEEELFDPTKHDVSDVLAYLEKSDADEFDRVVEVERAGKARKGILGG